MAHYSQTIQFGGPCPSMGAFLLERISASMQVSLKAVSKNNVCCAFTPDKEPHSAPQPYLSKAAQNTKRTTAELKLCGRQNIQEI